MQQAAASAPSASRAAAAVRMPWPSALSELGRLDIRRRQKVVRVDQAELSCDVAEARGLDELDEVLVLHGLFGAARLSVDVFCCCRGPGASGECSPVRSGRCAFWWTSTRWEMSFAIISSALASGGRPPAMRELSARRRQACQTRWRGCPKASGTIPEVEWTGCLFFNRADCFYSAGIYSFQPSSSDRKSVPRNHRWAETGLAQSIQSVDRPAGKKTRARRPLAAQIRIQNQAAQPNNAPHRWNQRTRASVRAQQRSREPPRTWLTTLWRPRPSARA